MNGTTSASPCGPQFSFYDPEVWPVWRAMATDPKQWDEFAEWGRKILAGPGFEDTERTYKLRAGDQVRRAMQALMAGQEDWIVALRAAFLCKENNITRWQAHDVFLSWCVENSNDADSALRLLGPSPRASSTD